MSVVSYTSGVEAFGNSFAGGFGTGGYGTVSAPIGAPMGMPMGQPMMQAVQPAPMQYQMPMQAQPTMQVMQQPVMQFAQAPAPQYQILSQPQMPMGMGMDMPPPMPMGMGLSMGTQSGQSDQPAGRYSYRQLTRGGAMSVASDQFLRAPEPAPPQAPSQGPTGPGIMDNYSCGIKLRELPGSGLQVVRLTMGSSAMMSNQVREGDMLASIDEYQVPQSNVDLATVKRRLNGARGSMVTLGMRRVDGEQYKVQLARNVRSAKKAMDVMLDKTMAFLNKAPTALDKPLIKPHPAHYGRAGTGIAPGQTRAAPPAGPMMNGFGAPPMMMAPPPQPMMMPPQPQPMMMTMQQPQMMIQQPAPMMMQQPAPMMMQQPRIIQQPAFGGFGGPSFPMYGGSVAADSFTPSIAIGDYAGEEEM